VGRSALAKAARSADRAPVTSLRQALEQLLSMIPVPRAIEDRPGPVDPRVDPEALEAFGRAEISGQGQPSFGGKPIIRRYSTERAADARAAHDTAPRDLG
jgi:hypothetical protein